MFWVVTEICSEQNVVKRMKLIKHFIKIASKFYCLYVHFVLETEGGEERVYLKSQQIW